jgi:hypothetical protein
VPNIIPEPLTLSLTLEPNLAAGAATKAVIVRWNGKVVVDRALSAETVVTWPIEGNVGINELVIEAALDPVSERAQARGARTATGVGVLDLRFTGR